VLKAGHFVFSDDMFDADLNDPIASQLRSIRDSHSTNPTPAKPKLTAQQLWDSDDEDKKKDAK
jgi:hypothetical protein